MSEQFMFTEGMLSLLLAEECKQHGLRAFCKKHDLDPGNVSNIINGKKPMIASVAKALGFAEEKRYVRLKHKKRPCHR